MTLAKLRSTAREHWALLAVLVLGLCLRAAVSVAYYPTLFYSDSWGYGMTARTHTIAGIFVPGFEPVRPSGYPLLVDVVGLIDRSAGLITAAQHVVGLVVGVLVYALAYRFGAPRLVAALAAAVVVLDSYAVALEHHVLSETAFGFTLLASLGLVAYRRGGSAVVVLSGLLLAFAVTIRPAGMFAVPAWMLFLIITRSNWRQVAAGAAALILPLLIYASAHAAAGRGFLLTETSGWFLYGRAGELADCKRLELLPEEKSLCAATAATPDRLRNPLYYIWSSRSPAQREFGEAINLSSPEAKRANDTLRGLAVKIIRSRPGGYAELVGKESFRFFEPGRMSPYGSMGDSPITFPEKPRDEFFDAEKAQAYFGIGTIPEIRPPSGAIRSYQEWVHTPRWLLGVLAAAGLLVTLLGLSRKARAAMTRRPETLLLLGGGLSIMVGTVATSSFSVRYLVPLVPLIVVGGVAALLDLASVFSRARQGALTRSVG